MHIEFLIFFKKFILSIFLFYDLHGITMASDVFFIAWRS